MEKSVKIAWVLDELPLCGGVKIPFGYCRELLRRGINSCIYANGKNEQLQDYYDVPVLPINNLSSFTDSDIIIAVWWMQVPDLEQYKGRKIQFVQGKDIEGMNNSYINSCMSVRSNSNWDILAVSDYAGTWTGREFTVIPNAVDDIFFHKLGIDRDIDAIIEGVDEPNKNIRYSIDKAKKDGCEKIVWFARQTHPIEGVITVTNPQQISIPMLYQRSKKFYKHSKSEGFCLPLAEAIISGCECDYSNMGGNNFEGLDFKWETSVNKLLEYLCINE